MADCEVLSLFIRKINPLEFIPVPEEEDGTLYPTENNNRHRWVVVVVVVGGMENFI